MKLWLLRRAFDLAVAAALAALHVVQVIVDQIVRVIAMGNDFMAASRPVLVSAFVVRAGVLSCRFGVLGSNRDGVLANVSLVHVVHMTVV